MDLHILSINLVAVQLADAAPGAARFGRIAGSGKYLRESVSHEQVGVRQMCEGSHSLVSRGVLAAPYQHQHLVQCAASQLERLAAL